GLVRGDRGDADRCWNDFDALRLEFFPAAREIEAVPDEDHRRNAVSREYGGRVPCVLVRVARAHFNPASANAEFVAQGIAHQYGFGERATCRSTRNEDGQAGQ